MEQAKFMVSIITDTTEIENWLVQNGFEFASTGVGSFEYVMDLDVDVDDLRQKLATMLIRVHDLRK